MCAEEFGRFEGISEGIGKESSRAQVENLQRLVTVNEVSPAVSVKLAKIEVRILFHRDWETEALSS